MAKEDPSDPAAAGTVMLKRFSKSTLKKVTAELYFPCRHCGLWRRQHIGKEKKCPFDASCFEPKSPKELGATERNNLKDRLEILRNQIINKPSKVLEETDMKIDAIVTLATSDCSHQREDGTSLLDRQSTEHGTVHTVCELCGEDWYE